jgi:hypothetical protein
LRINGEQAQGYLGAFGKPAPSPCPANFTYFR